MSISKILSKKCTVLEYDTRSIIKLENTWLWVTVLQIPPDTEITRISLIVLILETDCFLQLSVSIIKIMLMMNLEALDTLISDQHKRSNKGA